MLVKIDRPYGGAEGKRVRVGTRFWVKGPRGMPPEDVVQISAGRFQQLKSLGIASLVSAADDAKPAPRAKPERRPARAPLTGAPAKAKVLPDSQPPGVKAASRAAAPKAQPAPGSRPGSRTSAEGGQPLSSQAGRPAKVSTLKQRGVRRGDSPVAGSRPTTPIDSSPTPPPSTDATPDGGDITPSLPDDSSVLR